MSIAENAPGRPPVSCSHHLHCVATLLESIDDTFGPSVAWNSIDWLQGWPSPAGGYIKLVTVNAINEATPGPRWKALFDATWPGYRTWYLSEGLTARPDLNTATSMLNRHMPELMATYDTLVELADDALAARMLTMWNAPTFAPGCSQAVVTGHSPVLCRNYDYSPELWEQTVYSSAFTGRRVIGTGDCLWGLLDGMNDAGLVVSLTYGGAPGCGPGFAIPLVVRYLLEVATTVDQAREILRRLPIAMCYNLTLLDAHGGARTVLLRPGHPARFVDDLAATNHQGNPPDFPERAAALRSVTRHDRLSTVLEERPGPPELAEAFLRRPLYNDEYTRSFGTLYTALYRPGERAVDYIWPDRTWTRTFDDPDSAVSVTLRGR